MGRDRDQVIYIAGHRGMVGSALVRRLTALGYTNLLTASHAELDLLDQAAVNRFFPSSASTRSIWPPLGWVVSMPTTPTRPTSSTRTC